MTTPFSQPGTDLLPNYSAGTGGAAGDFAVTIPTNFQRVKSAVLGLHNRLAPLEAQNAVTSDNVSLRAGVNENFRVGRVGEAIIGAAVSSSTVLRVNSSAFLAGSGYAGGLVAATGTGTFNYVQSAFAGWMMPKEVFTNTGEVVAAGSGRGARFTFNGAVTYASDFGGAIAAGGGDFPALYQVLTRHMPIAALAGYPLTLRLRYSHTGAIAAGNEFKLYIAFVDAGGVRREALSAALVQTTGETVVSFSTGDSLAATVCPTGVIPATATSVEIGLALTANAGAFTNDPWDLYEFSATVGTQRSASAPVSVPVDLLESGVYYSQQLGQDWTGVQFNTSATPAYENPLVTAIVAAGGAVPPTAGVTSVVYTSPWPLMFPWKKANTALVPNCRVTEFHGAVVNSSVAIAYSLAFGTAPDNATVSLSVNVASGTSLPNVDQMAQSLTRILTIAPLATPGWINVLAEPELIWEGELACAIAPLNG